MSEEAVLRALQQAVTAAVAASGYPTLPVKYVDVAFTKPDNQKWLEIVYLPNNVQGDFWGDEKTYRGVLRLILHWPNAGGGAYGPLGLIGAIGDYFPVGRVLSGVKIYSRPDFTGVLEEKGDVLYPVSIRYESFREGRP